MVQTSARLLALLSLLQMRREWTGQELADRLEVGSRTIRRDVDKLRSLGYPVEAAPGVAGGYRLAELHLVDMFPQTFHMETVAILHR